MIGTPSAQQLILRKLHDPLCHHDRCSRPKISVNPEIVQFVRTADNAHDECLIVFGKDQLLRVRGSLDEVTEQLRHG